MLKDLEAIDTSSVEALAALNQESATVQELMERARSQKQSVPEAVVLRVMKDYGERLKSLDGQAHPLREKARAEYLRLQDLRGRVKAALDALLLDQQELKFRLQIGELKPEEFEAREKSLATQLAEAQENFDGVERVFGRFAAVLPSEAAPPAPSSDGPPTVPSGPSRAAEDDAAGPTLDVRRPEIPVPKAAETADGTTVVLSLARLVLRNEAGPETTYTLSAVTTIGRTPQNTIAIERPEVSRHHATVSMTETGWLLKDLGSGNGTFVNEARIKEHALREGDEIVIGTVHLVFREK